MSFWLGRGFYAKIIPLFITLKKNVKKTLNKSALYAASVTDNEINEGTVTRKGTDR